MLTRTLLLLSILIIAVSGFYLYTNHVSALAKETSSNPTNFQADSRFINPLEAINAAALKAFNTGVERKVLADEESIRNIFDAIFIMASVGNTRLPIDIENSLKTRLTQAEIKYREGKHKRISEAELAKAFNNLMGKFGLPEYSKTFVAQVRTVRISFMPHIPALIGKESRLYNQAPDRKVGQAIPTDMSPAEAILTAVLLMEQKQVNELYQTSPQEWVARNIELTDPNRKLRTQQANDLIEITDNPRTSEIYGSLLAKARSLRAEEMSNMIIKYIDDLGIQ